MLMIVALCLVAIANVIFAVLLCFFKARKQSFTLLKALGLMSLVCLGVTCAAYKNAFDAYSILLILSVLPLFVTLFVEPEKSEQKEVFQDKIGTVKTYQFDDGNKNWISKFGRIFNGSAYFVSTMCIVFCGLFLGIESPFGYFAGIFLGATGAFLEFLFRKLSLKENWLLFLEKLLYFVCAGLLLTTIFQVLFYAVNTKTILFSLAMLTYATNIVMELEFPNRYTHLSYYATMFLLFFTIIF